MSEYLPHEVLLEILLRLHIKSLVRFTCVCKSWNSIITDPSFITTHLNRTSASNNKTTDLLLLRQYFKNTKKKRYSLCHDNETLVEYAELEFPFQSLNVYFRGSCNGLLCLSDDFVSYTHTIILYNPSIRKSVTLPRPQITFNTHGPYMFVLGFGFDVKSNDYKVVRMVYLQGEGDHHGYDYVSPPEVELYSLSTGLWRGISAPAPLYYLMERSWSQALMNGVVHWPAFVHWNCNLILSFDLGNEVFHKMELPGSLVRECVQAMSIGVFGESLSVFHSDWLRKCWSIWVMKEYGVAESWSKQFTINLQGGVGRTLGLRKNGEILLSTIDGKLVSYHPETQRIKDIAIQFIGNSFYVDTYIESLVLLKEVNEVLRRKAKSCGVVTHKGAPVLLKDEENKNGEWRKNRAVAAKGQL